MIREAARECNWIKPDYLARTGRRKPGGESIIMRFLPSEVWQKYDFLVRFDADLAFGPDYIPSLLNEFSRDPLLGIASGTLLEPYAGGWREKRTPAYHTRGPSKIYSRECFAAIGGLEAGLGWDTIDEARAMIAGFHTRSFRHIRAYHRRIPGSARGIWHGQMDVGRAAFAAGYSPAFMLARALAHLHAAPWMAGGILMFGGYLTAWLRREQRLADKQVIRFVRSQQRRRLIGMNSLWV